MQSLTFLVIRLLFQVYTETAFEGMLDWLVEPGQARPGPTEVVVGKNAAGNDSSAG